MAVSGIAIRSEAARGMVSASPSAPGAARAVAVDDQVVAAHRVPEATRESLELALEALVLERRHPAAGVADGVVVMLTAGNHGLEAGGALPEFHALDEAQLVEQLESAVDTGDPDVVAGLAQVLRDPQGRVAAALPGEELDYGRARTARAVAGLAQRGSRAVLPVGRLPVNHARRLPVK